MLRVSRQLGVGERRLGVEGGQGGREGMEKGAGFESTVESPRDLSRVMTLNAADPAFPL